MFASLGSNGTAPLLAVQAFPTKFTSTVTWSLSLIFARREVAGWKDTFLLSNNDDSNSQIFAGSSNGKCKCPHGMESVIFE